MTLYMTIEPIHLLLEVVLQVFLKFVTGNYSIAGKRLLPCFQRYLITLPLQNR